MKYLIKNIILFAACFLVFSGCIVGCYLLITQVTFKDTPPPNFSNSIAFNDKLLFIQNKKADIIAIGSSMTLNNLDSKTIVKRFNNNSYLNLGSWGICIKDIFLLLKEYSRFHTPEVIIMSSNLIDFESKSIKINYDNIYNFLSSENTRNYIYHLKNFNASYYANNFVKIKEYKQNQHIYEYLGYDVYGAVLLDSSGFKIGKKRWAEAGFTHPQALQYNYLDSLSLFCSLKNIKFYFFQSPFREGIYDLPQKHLNVSEIEQHVAKVRALVEKRDQYFVDATKNTWKNNLFLDAIHFHNKGAELYTEYCFQSLYSIKNE